METVFGTPIICPVLIGRATDLATLHLLIEQAKGGRGHVAMISGEAGIGKSRLVTEAKIYAATHNFLLLQGNCFPTDFSCPYAPLLDLLRSSAASHFLATAIASDLAPFVRELHHLLPDVVSVPPDVAPLSTPDPEQQKRRLFTALAQESGSLFWIRTTTGFLAMAHMLQHELAQAGSLLTTALDPDTPSQTLGQRIVWYARAELALARDDPHLALHITDQLLASSGLSSESSIPGLSKLRGEALTKLKQGAEAETILQDARVTALKHGLRPLLWRIYVTQGKLAHSQRKYEEAERRFAAAREMLEDLASSLPDELLQQHFLQHAQALFPHTRQPSSHRLTKKTFEGLTQRERAVAALIARGKSNREIAEELVVAPRTIETHVSSILSKLGLTSRTQIAVWATEKGLSNDAM
jgi:DNA-binding CsgD family transcriptional regulator